MRCIMFLGLAAAMSTAAAAPIVDGTRDVDYGSPLAVQTTQTQFGDNLSELNAGYGVIDSGKLYLMLTGNIENNFNKLEIFIDSKAGGQSVFSSAGNDGAGAMDGLVFDTPLTADYHLIARRGSGKFDLDFADLGTSTFNFYEDVFGGTEEGSGSTGTGVNAIPIELAYDNSNTAGVMGGDGAADQSAAAAVTTGVELAIDLADLDYVGGPIRVMVGQNNQGHNFWSNQFLGGLDPPQGNIGGPGNKDFSMIGGTQFFTVIPEPSSIALAGLAIGVTVLGRHRRK